ncbi:MAG TPA: UDP-N-acetylmuramoyl-tripeptide--D-alanyl-D-alanine ligase [Acidimicrobiia bacterium]
MDLTRDDVAAITGGRPVGPAAVARGFAFDSRTLEPGQGFLALRAERDGHEFVAAAFARGAALAVVERVPDGVDGPVVVVDDVAVALRALGVAARDRLEPASVVGITGSAGKTSTKDLTAAALAPALRVHASSASFNNEIGLPVTLLDAPTDAQAVVLEMGARFAGNIAELCAIARPSVGVVTHVGLAHAEYLGGPEGIARVKGELLVALPADGLAVLNADCERVDMLRALSAAPVLTVGTGRTADVRTSDLRVDAELRASFRLESPWGVAPEIRLAVRGAHQVANAAQAATVALHLGVPLDAVVAALAAAETATWRMELIESDDHVIVINDAYNASPSSMRAALETFGRLAPPGRRIAVLGEMLELGPIGVDEHARVGDLVADAGVAALVTVGAGTDELAAAAKARGVEVVAVADRDAAVSVLRTMVLPGDAVLVKASRLVGLEAVAAALLAGDGSTS